MTEKSQFDKIISINGNLLTKKYIASLNSDQRIELVEPLFVFLRNQGFLYPQDTTKINSEWKRLLDFKPDITSDEIFNNSSLATYICKYFCAEKFYNTTELGERTIPELFNDDDVLRKLIINRLGLGWYDSEPHSCFNLSFRMFIQGLRSMRYVNLTSIFKPSVAKYLVMKYSNENDTIYDYSAGFGGRLLGTIAANRNYIGVDPLTISDLTNMANYLKLNNYRLITSGSENFRDKKNSIDMSFSSPPYLMPTKKFQPQEFYSADKTQAYNNGEDYFYNIYWKNTLENIKYMLKPNKYYLLNVANSPKMVEMAKEYFGEPVEIVKLRTVRSHLNKSGKDDAQKFEPVYVFKNFIH